MFPSRFLFLLRVSLFFVVVALCGVAPAQIIGLKDGSRLSLSQVTIGDGKLFREKIIGTQKAQVTINFSEIEYLEWPNPKQIADARNQMGAGKVKEALQTLAEAKQFFKPFRDIKGNPYPQVVFAQAEAMDAAGDFDELVKVIPELNGMKWDDDQSLKLRIMKLNMDRRTSSDTDGILMQAQVLLKDTDDSSVCAKLWMTIGELLSKKQQYEEALYAYLNIPVFYGSQAAMVPPAELAAARSLVKLERFEDAAGMFQRISDAYPGSEVAEAAKKERLAINGLKNKPDNFGKKSKTGDKDKDKDSKNDADNSKK